MRIAAKLKEAGFAFFQPIKTDKGGGLREGVVRTTEEPKSRRYSRIEAANIPDKFKKELANPELHRRLGIPEDIPDKRLLVWFGMREEGMESPEAVADRVRQGMANTQKQLPRLAGALGPDKRIVVIAAGNASMVDAAIYDLTGSHPQERGGEAPNCEGFKVDFKIGAEEPGVETWGEEIERVGRRARR